jgi:hypothetical protein
LCAFYASIINFCSKALRHLEHTSRLPSLSWTTIGETESNSSKGSSLVQALWSPFEKEFKDFGEELRERNETVAAEIQLASEMAAAKEREAAVEYRKSGSAFRSELKRAANESTEWRLRKEQQKISQKCRKQSKHHLTNE